RYARSPQSATRAARRRQDAEEVPDPSKGLHRLKVPHCRVRSHPAPSHCFFRRARAIAARRAELFPHSAAHARSHATNTCISRRQPLAVFLLQCHWRPMTSDDEVDRAVLAYLEAHPSAADTLEGITAWWLEQRRVRYGVEIVSGALDRL